MGNTIEYCELCHRTETDLIQNGEQFCLALDPGKFRSKQAMCAVAQALQGMGYGDLNSQKLLRNFQLPFQKKP